MGLSTFIGGVHPYEGKELSSDKPIQVIQPKGELVFPLSQHIGAPAAAAVKAGDHVTAGQVIGAAQDGKLGVNIHASVDGTVTEVSDKYVVIHL